MILRADTQLRLAPSGNVLGFDLTPLLVVAEALGYCRQAFVTLISSAEVGMLQGIRDMQNGNS